MNISYDIRSIIINVNNKNTSISKTVSYYILNTSNQISILFSIKNTTILFITQ